MLFNKLLLTNIFLIKFILILKVFFLLVKILAELNSFSKPKFYTI
jgi:hypothetical protein